MEVTFCPMIYCTPDIAGKPHCTQMTPQSSTRVRRFLLIAFRFSSRIGNDGVATMVSLSGSRLIFLRPHAGQEVGHPILPFNFSKFPHTGNGNLSVLVSVGHGKKSKKAERRVHQTAAHPAL